MKQKATTHSVLSILTIFVIYVAKERTEELLAKALMAEFFKRLVKKIQTPDTQKIKNNRFLRTSKNIYREGGGESTLPHFFNHIHSGSKQIPDIR